MSTFVPTKAVTVRVPLDVVDMLNAITRNTGQTNKDTIEQMIQKTYAEMKREGA